MTVFICLTLLGACRSMSNRGGTDWATVDFSINGPSSENRRLSVSQSSIQEKSILILAVAGDVAAISSSDYLVERYDLALQDLDTGIVELSVPLNTSIRLVKVVFNQDISLSTIRQEQPTSFYTGLSEAFTVSGTETSKTVTIDFNWKTVDFSFSEPLSANIQYSVSGSSVQTALTLAISGSNTDFSISNYLVDWYDVALQNLDAGTVSLNVPPDTSLRLATVVFYDVLTLDTILAEQPTPFCASVSDAFTVSAADTSRTVTIDFEGIPDVTFNSTGFIRHSNAAGGDGTDNGAHGIIDSDGRILVGGSSVGTGSENVNLALWRYEADGTLDTSFGTNGIVVRNDSTGGNYFDKVYGVAEDTNGKILAVGYTYPGGTADITVWRFNSDGSLDTAFGSGGMFVHAGAAGGSGKTELGNSIVLDSSGRIIVVGNGADNSSLYHMVLMRLTTTGTLDTSFGTSGIVVYDYDNSNTGNTYNNIYKVTTDPSGRILVTGSSDVGSSNQDMHLWRFDSEGSPDTSFDSDGLVTHGNAADGDGADVGNGLVVDSNGRILVIGQSSNGTDNDMVIWCFNADGSLDTAFGTNGVVIESNVAGGNGNDQGNAITTDSAGRILATGTSGNGSNFDTVIWRYNTKGTLDTTFGLNGVVIFDNGEDNRGQGILLDSDQRVVVIGRSSVDTNIDMAIWRYR